MEIETPNHDMERDDAEAHSVTSNPNDQTSNNNDSSLDSDVDDDEEERKLEEKATTLTRQIDANRYDYDAHVELTNVYFQLGQLDLLRNAYEKFHDVFPLSEELWLKWIKTEISLNLEFAQLNELFKKAFDDYLSIPVWLEYLECTLPNDQLSAADKREICQDAVQKAGLHVTQSDLIWDAYYNFEKTHLETLTSDDERPKQIERIAHVALRRFGIPLLNCSDAYRRFLQDNLPIADKILEQIHVKYNATLKEFERIATFEERLAEATDDSAKYTCFKEYFAVERGNPVRLATLYERAVAELPLYEDIWLEYCAHAGNLGPDHYALGVCRRAVRNCPGSYRLWIAFVETMEKFGGDYTAIIDLFKTAHDQLKQLNPSGDGMLQLAKSYLECLRRVFVAKISADFTVETLRKEFYFANEQVKSLGMNTSVILRFLVRTEAHVFNDLKAAEKLWTSLVKKIDLPVAAWIEYAHIEEKYGDAGRLRRVFEQAFYHTKDWTIAELWANYESDHGDLRSIEKCRAACERISNASQRRNEWEMGDQNRKRKMDDFSLPIEPFKRPREQHRAEMSDQRGKRRRDDPPPVNDPPKRSRDQTYESNLPTSIAELKVDENSTEKSPGKPNSRSARRNVHLDEQAEPRTVFVSNLAPEITEADLRAFFQGDAKRVVLVTDVKTGHSKGYAYVEVESEEDVAKHLNRDREPLNARPVFLSRCRGQRKEREHAFKYEMKREPNKLFVKGLPKTYTKMDVERLFEPFGTIKDIRMVLFRSGQFKGIAYVEYENPGDAEKAITATDQTDVAGFTITVAVSDPPQKTDPIPETKSFKKRELNPSRVKRTRVQITSTSFLPSSLRNGANKPKVVEKQSEDVGKNVQLKSNADFRAMLLGDGK